MEMNFFPMIDLEGTGRNIARLRKERNLSVKDLQAYFGFEEPQAIYKWQWGKSLPTVDNLYALSILLDVPMDEILVPANSQLHKKEKEQQMRASVALPFIRKILYFPLRILSLNHWFS